MAFFGMSQKKGSINKFPYKMEKNFVSFLYKNHFIGTNVIVKCCEKLAGYPGVYFMKIIFK